LLKNSSINFRLID